MRCRKHDEGDRGCIAEAGHKGKCTIRRNPDQPQPETWPCIALGCDRRVKHEGARCPVHRGMLKSHSTRRDAEETLTGPRPPRPGLRPAAPTDAAEPRSPRIRDGQDLVKRHIEGLTVQDVIANKAARKTLVGLGRALLAMFDKPEMRKTDANTTGP